MFNQELATLLKAGMPLVQSLDILRRRVANPVFKAVLDDVHERVRAGSALSEAFEAHGTMFPGVYTASLLAGEKSGNLEQVIRRYVAYVKVVSGVRRKTISALVYPAILLVLSLVVVVDHRAEGRARSSARSTTSSGRSCRCRRGSSSPSRTLPATYFLALVAGAALLAVGVLVVAEAARPARRFDRLMLRMPGLGAIAQKFATSQAARTLATLLGGGIPLVNAIDVVGAVDRQPVTWRGSCRPRRSRCAKGGRWRSAMSDSGAFPDVAIKMVEVGESTGALQEMLNSLADFYDEEIETNLGRFVTLVEPILLVIMGIVIAGLLLALYMPLFNLVERACAERIRFERITMDVKHSIADRQRERQSSTPDSRDRCTIGRPSRRPRSPQARRLAERYRLEFVDLDAVQHRPRAVPQRFRRT